MENYDYTPLHPFQPPNFRRVPDSTEDRQRQLDLKRRIKDSGYSVTGYRDPNLNAKMILGIVCLDVNRLINFSQEYQASKKYFLIAKCLYMAST